MFDNFLEIVGDAVITAFGAIFAFFFFEFWWYGKVWAFEPNTMVAFLEFLMSVVILFLGVNRLKGDWKED